MKIKVTEKIMNSLKAFTERGVITTQGAMPSEYDLEIWLGGTIKTDHWRFCAKLSPGPIIKILEVDSVKELEHHYGMPIDDAVHKSRPCQPFIEVSDYGKSIELGSIVEGRDSTTWTYELRFPFSIIRFEEVLDSIQEEVDEMEVEC